MLGEMMSGMGKAHALVVGIGDYQQILPLGEAVRREAVQLIERLA
jgi:hypothetical protein